MMTRMISPFIERKLTFAELVAEAPAVVAYAVAHHWCSAPVFEAPLSSAEFRRRLYLAEQADLGAADCETARTQIISPVAGPG